MPSPLTRTHTNTLHRTLLCMGRLQLVRWQLNSRIQPFPAVHRVMLDGGEVPRRPATDGCGGVSDLRLGQRKNRRHAKQHLSRWAGNRFAAAHNDESCNYLINFPWISLSVIPTTGQWWEAVVAQRGPNGGS